MAVFMTFLNPGDTVLGLDLAHGGHLTHGSHVNFSGQLYNFISYHVDKKTGRVDFNEVEQLAKKNKPKLIICDEITSALDTIVAQQILDLLGSLQDELGLSYLFITHNIATVAQISKKIAVMRNGQIIQQGYVEEVLTPPCHEYTQLLLNSVPEMRTDWLDTAVIERRDLLKKLNLK